MSKEQILQDVHEGRTTKAEAAKALGVSPRTIGRWLYPGLKKRKLSPKLPVAPVAQVVVEAPVAAEAPGFLDSLVEEKFLQLIKQFQGKDPVVPSGNTVSVVLNTTTIGIQTHTNEGRDGFVRSCWVNVAFMDSTGSLQRAESNTDSNPKHTAKASVVSSVTVLLGHHSRGQVSSLKSPVKVGAPIWVVLESSENTHKFYEPYWTRTAHTKIGLVTPDREEALEFFSASNNRPHIHVCIVG
jgi:hypothetical protein